MPSRLEPQAAAPTGERGLLRGLLEALLDGSDRAIESAPTILRRAEAAGLFPLLYGHLRDENLELSPAAHQRWRAHLAWIELLRLRLQGILEALGDIEHAVLKGLPLAVTAYGKLHARSVGDVDLLLRPDDVPRARDRLEAAGYAAPEGARPWYRGNNQFALRHPRHGLTVELHWALALPSVPSPSAAELLRRRVWVPLDDGLSVPALDAPASLIHLVLHYHHHLGFAAGLVDIAAWLDRQGGALAPDPVRESCRRLGLYGILQWPLHVLRSLTGTTPPLFAEDTEPQVRLFSRLAAARTRGWLARDGGPAPARSGSPLARRMAWRLVHAALLDGCRAKAVGALQPVFHGPRAHAEYRGEPRVTLATYAQVALRPWTLARKLWSGPRPQ